MKVVNDLSCSTSDEVNSIVATIPAGVVGLLGKPLIEDAAESTTVAACGLLATAVFL